MKKIVFILTLALSASFFGCGSDDDVTTLRWDNGSGSQITEINWCKDTYPTATWSYSDAAPLLDEISSSKTISNLDGTVDGWADGGEVEFMLSKNDSVGVVSASGKAAKIEENADATVFISGVSKKK